VQLNKGVLIGRIGERGVKLTSSEQAVPTCSYCLDVGESGTDVQAFTTHVPVEIMGRYTDGAEEGLDAGDEVMIDGTVTYRSITDPKTKMNRGRLLSSSWTVTQAAPTMPAAGAVP
jgi:single-stranded DNA-binding protein